MAEHIPTLTDVKRHLQQALDRFIAGGDRYLLANHLGERSVSHRLALHLQAELSEWSVDCEWNKVGAAVKGLNPPDNPAAPLSWHDTEANTVYPDIIVHKRGPDGPNLLVIEMKKSAGARANFDRDKLQSFTGPDLCYEFGAFIPFTTGDSGSFGQIEWFCRHDGTGPLTGCPET